MANYNGKIQSVRRRYDSLRNFIGRNEVYKAGYKMAEGSAEKQTIKLTGEGAAEKNEDGQYEFSFANEYDDTVVEGSGALNRYENKQYVTKASGQEEEPAA